MEIRIISIPLSLFDYHPLIFKECIQFNKHISTTVKTNTGVTIRQCFYNFVVALYDLLTETFLQCLSMLLLCQFSKWKTTVLFGLVKNITCHHFGQSIIIYTERKGLEIFVTNVHCFHLANIHVFTALCYLQDGFRLVVKFSTNMSSCIVITFVQVQYGVNMQVIST